MSDDIEKIKKLYDARSKYGKYSTLAPNSKGGLKSEYVASVFDEALLPYVQDLNYKSILLDYGCGTGIFIKKIEDVLEFIIGTDISIEMLNIAKVYSNKDKVRLLMLDGKTLPFESGVIDCIIAREVLCHVPDDYILELLKRFYDCLSKEGKFLLLDQVSESKYWQSHPNAPLIKKRSVDNILSMFRQVGFVLETKYVVRKPRFFWIYLFQFRLMPKIFLKPLAKIELFFNKRIWNVRTSRWHDVMFVFSKPT